MGASLRLGKFWQRWNLATRQVEVVPDRRRYRRGEEEFLLKILGNCFMILPAVVAVVVVAAAPAPPPPVAVV